MDLYHRSPPIKKKWYLIIAIMLQCSNWTAQWKKCKDYKWFWPVLGERYSFWVRLQKAIQSNPWQYNSSKNEGILQYIVSFFQHFVIHLKKKNERKKCFGDKNKELQNSNLHTSHNCQQWYRSKHSVDSN